MGPHVASPVVELFLELVFNDLALFFNHQNLFEPRGKGARGLRLQRPDHRHLVQANAQPAAGRFVQAQVGQGLAGVVEGFAAGDQTQAVVGSLDHVVIEPVGPHISERGVPLVLKQALLLRQRRVGPTDVHAAWRHLHVGGQHNAHALGVNLRRGRGLHNFLNGLHARPHAGIAAHGNGVQAQVQDVLHAGREKHRQPAGLEDVVALVRRCRALGHMVVTGHRQHTAPRRGARHVGVLEHIGAAVHTRSLAVPNAKHAVKLVAAGRGKAQLLRAPQGRGGQLLVHAWLKVNVTRFEVLGRLPKRLVVATQGRAPVA